MATTFDDNERSVSQGRPIDLYTIVTPTAFFRLTSHPVDVSYLGDTYVATPMGRGEQEIAQDSIGRELVVHLPISHALVQSFASSGVPEQSVAVTLVRLQTVSGLAQQGWAGYATGLTVTGRMAALRVPSVADDALRVKIPIVRAQKLCNHRLYDARCQINRDDFRVLTTGVSQTASSAYAGTADLVIASIDGNPDGWAKFGEVLRPSGEMRHILAHTSTTLTINAPFGGLAPGDALTVYAGCGHLVGICRLKFNNVVNFGGHPHMNPTIDPWALKGLGVIQQP